METEFAVIGGGVVGLSIAYGLLKNGQRVVIYDEGDQAIRASRGNFGLVWVQSKGMGEPAYARWSRQSAATWRGYAAELQDRTGEDLALVQDGGFIMHLDEEALDRDRKNYQGLRDRLDGDYPFEVLGHNALKAEEPLIGPDVVGALYCAEDGHVNPLKLLRGLAAAVRSMGGQVRTDSKVLDVAPDANGFLVRTANSETRHGKVILSAGLGAMDLGPRLGFKTLIRPQQGQVLITEKLPKILNRPNVEVRQVNEGGVQIGASSAEVGLDIRETISTTAALAKRAIKLFPVLAKAKLVRSWAALRILSPDGIPIYQQSDRCPGAYFVTCHSGVTLAAAHSEFLVRWILNQPDAPDLAPFSEARFDV